MPSVFISRHLGRSSIFRQELEAAGWQVQGKSLITFRAVPFQRIPRAQWIFFYSKNAVKFFFKGLKTLGRKPPKVRWATIGKSTAKALQRQGIEADFVGQGNAMETAWSFLLKARQQVVLFPRAQSSRQSIQELLGDKIIDKNLIVYRNQPKRRFSISDCDFLVFTSPMNAETYFASRELHQGQCVIAIGRTTAKTLTGLGIDEIQTAEEPSEEALAKVVLAQV